MKVLLVSNYAPDQQYSMLGFAECLKRELPKIGLQPTLLSPKPRLGQSIQMPKLRKWLAYVDKYILFPQTLRIHAANHDLTHILDHGNAMYVPHLATRKHLITCHDMLAIRASLGEIPDWKLGPTGMKYQSLILSGLKKSHRIAAVSGATQEDVLRLTGLPEERVQIVYNGLYQDLSPLPVDKAATLLVAQGIQRPFFLHVGGDSPYKNRSGLLDIYHHLLNQIPYAPDLVLAGRKPSEKVANRIAELPPGKVRLLVSPDSETLTALYQSAEALIFPSTHEGFGLPIIEAQALGCPVFTSNRPPMTEVGGKAATYFDPSQPESAARTIAQVLGDTAKMKAMGRENVVRFSASEMAQNYLRLYKDICGESQS